MDRCWVFPILVSGDPPTSIFARSVLLIFGCHIIGGRPPGAYIVGGEWGLPHHHRRNRPFRPLTNLRLMGRKILPAPKAPVKSKHFFHLENEVYLVKIAFASKNLENFSAPAGYFFVRHS